MRLISSIVPLIALVFAMSGAVAPQAGLAQEGTPVQATGTIEVHARSCEDVPADWFAECHDDVSPDTPVTATNTETGEIVDGTTDQDGTVVLEVSPGTWQIAGPPGEFLKDSFLYCSYSDAPGQDIGHPVVIEAGANVVCDLYFVPDNLSGLVDVTVHTNLCIAPGCSELPEALEPANGVGVTFSDPETGKELGTCTSEAGTCVIGAIPMAAPVSVMVNPNTIPEGYALEPNPAVYELTGEQPEVWILLLPVGGFPGMGTPVPTATTTSLPHALELPASLYAGTCADLDAATSAEPLNDLVIVDGEQAGSPAALQVASGYTNIAMPIDEILNGEYAIAVLDEDQSVIACGDIGGVLDEDDALSIGLAPVDDSGAAGVAYLAPRDEGTGISVFLVPDGLMPTPMASPEA